MEWQVITALVVGIPIILFPAAYVWYLTLGGVYGLVRERRGGREAAKERATVR